MIHGEFFQKLRYEKYSRGTSDSSDRTLATPIVHLPNFPILRDVHGVYLVPDVPYEAKPPLCVLWVHQKGWKISIHFIYFLPIIDISYIRKPHDILNNPFDISLSMLFCFVFCNISTNSDSPRETQMKTPLTMTVYQRMASFVLHSLTYHQQSARTIQQCNFGNRIAVGH